MGRRFSSGSMGLATRSSSSAARLGLLPEEPEEDADMYEELAPASNILVDGFAVPKVIRCISNSAISGLLQLLLPSRAIDACSDSASELSSYAFLSHGLADRTK